MCGIIGESNFVDCKLLNRMQKALFHSGSLGRGMINLLCKPEKMES